MKVFIIFISICVAFGGTFGINIAGGAQYESNRDYQNLTPEQVQDMFYGGEVSLMAEAFPNVFLEPTVVYFNNPQMSSSAAGVGLAVNITPRLGCFPIAPHFGVDGTILFYNDIPLTQAAQNGNINEYLETSTPRFMGTGFLGLSLFLGNALSLDCNYRYHSMSREYVVEMIWGGITYYVNW